MGKLNRYLILTIYVLMVCTVPMLAEDAQQDARSGEIAYVGSDRNIYIARLEEETFLQLTDDAQEERRYQWPTWSNDGRLAYFCCEPVSAESLTLEVYVAGQESSESEQVYNTAGQVFYHAYWSPAACGVGDDCRDLAVLLNDTRDSALTIQLIRSAADGTTDFAIANGQPFYYSWSPDGQKMLWQRGNTTLSVFDVLENSVADLEQLPGGMQAPLWSPVDSRLLFGARNAGDETTDLVVVEGETVLTLVEGVEGLISYLWSPDGRYIAYRVLSRSSLARVVIVESQSGEVVASPETDGVFAFLWSPDSTKLAYITAGQAEGGSSAAVPAIPVAASQQGERAVLVWSVLDLQNDTLRRFEGFVPTAEMIYFFNFFDQFADSHHLWSPDSTRLVFGQISPEGKPVVSILDITRENAVPSYLADGYVGVWSYE